tara:strand:- start:4245 stop:4733 length:489 start_codon:yes stop_codon:yes gene_type:complete
MLTFYRTFFVQLLSAAVLLAAPWVWAGPGAEVQEPVMQSNSLLSPRYQANIELHSAAELERLLQEAERLVLENKVYPRREPVAFVLKGPEVALFTRANYEANRSMVDLAARLAAFEVVDLKVCESWLSSHRLTRADFPAFIDYVTDGHHEVQRLQSSGYAFF